MLLDAFKSPPHTREEGVYFDDRQYKCVRADSNSIYAKYVSANRPKVPEHLLRNYKGIKRRVGYDVET